MTDDVSRINQNIATDKQSSCCVKVANWVGNAAVIAALGSLIILGLYGINTISLSRDGFHAVFFGGMSLIGVGIAAKKLAFCLKEFDDENNSRNNQPVSYEAIV
ncbi:MAG: hypothetical protein ACD_20C00273G0001 [uncultured bacterium]|nr:MAG: hypothetical protein ACD_20C00273G0001 [uncultured bacterium]